MSEAAEALASAWLGTLAERMAQGDAAGAAALFAVESYWRDLLPFTWSVVTLEGPDQIRAMLQEVLPYAKPVAFWLEPGSARQQDDVTEAWFPLRDGRAARPRPPAAEGRAVLDAADGGVGAEGP
jgi:putative flavoprotein involved in K+ transport